jgi:uncharacterized protein DUF6220
MAALAIFAWLFLAGVVYQFFLAGMGLLGGGDMTNHIGFGWTLPLVAILVFLVALAVRPGWRIFGLTSLLMVLTFVQIGLPSLRDQSPFLAALHPVNALAIFWLALTIAQRATARARSMTTTAPDEAPEEVPDEVRDEVPVPKEA